MYSGRCSVNLFYRFVVSQGSQTMIFKTGRGYTLSSEYPMNVMKLKDFPTHSYFGLPVGD